MQTQFLRYETRGGAKVAIFALGFNPTDGNGERQPDEHALNRHNLQIRIANLKQSGLDTTEEETALTGMR